MDQSSTIVFIRHYISRRDKGTLWFCLLVGWAWKAQTAEPGIGRYGQGQ